MLRRATSLFHYFCRNYPATKVARSLLREPSLTMVLTRVHRFSLTFLMFQGGHFVARFQHSRESFIDHSRKKNRRDPRIMQLVLLARVRSRRFKLLDCQSCARRRISIRYRQIRARRRWYADKCNEYSDFHYLSDSVRGANASNAVLGTRHPARVYASRSRNVEKCYWNWFVKRDVFSEFK